MLVHAHGLRRVDSKTSGLSQDIEALPSPIVPLSRQVITQNGYPEPLQLVERLDSFLCGDLRARWIRPSDNTTISMRKRGPRARRGNICINTSQLATSRNQMRTGKGMRDLHVAPASAATISIVGRFQLLIVSRTTLFFFALSGEARHFSAKYNRLARGWINNTGEDGTAMAASRQKKSKFGERIFD